jgi:hypothetical protein
VLHNKRPSVLFQIHIIISQINCWISNSFNQNILFLVISKILWLSIPIIETAYYKSETLKNTNVHKNCLGPRGLTVTLMTHKLSNKDAECESFFTKEEKKRKRTKAKANPRT